MLPEVTHTFLSSAIVHRQVTTRYLPPYCNLIQLKFRNKRLYILIQKYTFNVCINQPPLNGFNEAICAGL